MIFEIDFEHDEKWLDGPLPGGSDGWRGLEKIMPALVDRFCLSKDICLEFGVEYGYSTSVLAQLFRKVIGIDRFTGDEHSGIRSNYRTQTISNLSRWPNIDLYEMDYRLWMETDPRNYDLIHVDLSHDYETTYAAGIWAVNHSPVVIFHDTESFPEVKRAVRDISEKEGISAYNYPHCNGLGILA